MVYDRYPAPQESSNQPQYVREEPHYLSEQPASRTRFYRDKRHGKLFGICAGIAD
jgi:phage shock protein C